MVKPDLSEEEFNLFQNFILENSGIFLDKSREDSLRISLLSRISVKGFRSYREYYSFLKSDPLGEEEFKELLSFITINETYFFRNPSHFKFLKEYVFPELMKKKTIYWFITAIFGGFQLHNDRNIYFLDHNILCIPINRNCNKRTIFLSRQLCHIGTYQIKFFLLPLHRC